MTRNEAHNLYSHLNDNGHGFAIGDDDQTIADALIEDGYEYAGDLGDGLVKATKGSATYLVGGDAMGRNAWAVQI